jgi:linoleoyl-CoA desaturase
MAPLSAEVDYSEFTSVLRRRLDRFFREQQISPRATPLMWAKIAGGLGAFAVSYGALYLRAWPAAQFTAIYVLHGLTQLFLLLNVAHDTNHGSISDNRRINHALAWVFDLCGINSYIWRLLHNSGHHPNINIRGDDEDIIARNYLRLTPDTPPHWRYRLQHWYAWFLYGFSTLDYVLLKDLEYFYFPRYRRLAGVLHGIRQHATLIAWKIFYFGYMIVLPHVVLGISWPTILTAFVAMHFVIGVLAQLVFQPGHAVETSDFPSSKAEFDNYTSHIFATTADFSTQAKWATVFLGGLNHHVVHHLCPNVCHTHYPRLTGIVRETAAEYGIPYHEYPHIGMALADHFRHLKRLAHVGGRNA